MRTLRQLAIATLVLGANVGAAQAAVNLSATPLAVSAPSGLTLVTDFNSPAIANGFTFTGGLLQTGSNTLGAEPAGDSSQYLSVLGNQIATLTYSGPGSITDLSVYIGSLDSYNKITFYGTGAFSGAGESLLGTDLTASPGGSHTAALDNQRFNFTFTGGTVDEVAFYSGYNSLEIDNIAAAVPEPGTWAMMMVGLGLIGFMLRNNRKPKNQAVMA
jgi:hypothetical protein